MASKRTKIRALFSLMVLLVCLLFSFLISKEPVKEAEPEPVEATPKEEDLVSVSIEQEGLPQMIKAVETLPDWQLSGKPQYTEGDDLFVLINGGAEIYLEYGFSKAVLANFKDSGGKTIIVEIYEMSSSDAAYGMYTFKTDKEAKVLDIGGEAKLSGYYLNLWKNNFVITLTSADPKTDVALSLQEAARELSEAIETEGVKPELITLLTKIYANENPEEVKYLKGNIALSAQQFKSPALLAIKEGAVVDFGDIKVFVFKYGDPEEAKEQFEKAVKGHEDRDGFSLVFQVNQNYVSAVQGTSEAKASKRLEGIRELLGTLSR